MITTCIGASARYRLQVFKSGTGGEAVGPAVRDTLWFDNLITDAGLDMWAGSGSTVSVNTSCRVGSGSTPPAVGDNSLESEISETTSRTGQPSFSLEEGPPYKATSSKTFEFGVGDAAGNISEVGMAQSKTDDLFSRALVKDESGLPTTITVLSDEILRVTYELSMIVPSESTSVIDVGGVPTTVFMTAARVDTSGLYWGAHPVVNYSSNRSYAYPMGSTLGGVTGRPSGVGTKSITSVNTKLPGLGEWQTVISFGLADANFSGGISAFLLDGYNSAGGTYQMSFDPPLPKTASDTLSITFHGVLSRHTP